MKHEDAQLVGESLASIRRHKSICDVIYMFFYSFIFDPRPKLKYYKDLKQ